MQRRDFLTKAAASAATGGAILGAPAVIGQAPAVRWRLTSAFPKSLGFESKCWPRCRNTLYRAKNSTKHSDHKVLCATHCPSKKSTKSYFLISSNLSRQR